jgi:hypothetical protein
VFRPNSSVPLLPVSSGAVPLSGHVAGGEGVLVSEVSQSFASWLHQRVVLVAGEPFARFEWSVGELPVMESGMGIEVVSKFNSDIQSEQVWFTDSNGRELQKRIRFKRPDFQLNVTEPIAGEYYPGHRAE